jgi:hypothetical protein
MDTQVEDAGKEGVFADEAAMRLETMEEAKPAKIDESSIILADPHPLQPALPLTGKEKIFLSYSKKVVESGGQRMSRSNAFASVRRDREEEGVSEEWDTNPEESIGKFDDEGNFIFPPTEPEETGDEEGEGDRHEKEDEGWTVVGKRARRSPDRDKGKMQLPYMSPARRRFQRPQLQRKKKSQEGASPLRGKSTTRDSFLSRTGGPKAVPSGSNNKASWKYRHGRARNIPTPTPSRRFRGLFYLPLLCDECARLSEPARAGLWKNNATYTILREVNSGMESSHLLSKATVVNVFSLLLPSSGLHWRLSSFASNEIYEYFLNYYELR